MVASFSSHQYNFKHIFYNFKHIINLSSRMATQVINQVGIDKFEIDSRDANTTTTDLITIPDAEHNPHIIALARYAVNVYAMDKRGVRFVKVIHASKQPLGGVSGAILYYITLEIKHTYFRVPNKECETRVVEAWEGRNQNVIDFKEVRNAA